MVAPVEGGKCCSQGLVSVQPCWCPAVCSPSRKTSLSDSRTGWESGVSLPAGTLAVPYTPGLQS